jgi:hypothetical protein
MKIIVETIKSKNLKPPILLVLFEFQLQNGLTGNFTFQARNRTAEKENIHFGYGE